MAKFLLTSERPQLHKKIPRCGIFFSLYLPKANIVILSKNGKVDSMYQLLRSLAALQQTF
jgi:hypothetical protein